jgi:chromosome segregation ATPase
MSYNRYFSPAQVESDQKDVIISQLKAELFELKQNHKNYQEINTHLTNLEHRHNLLLDEKNRNEREFRARHEANQATILALKGEIDTLKGQLATENLSLNDLKSENYELAEIVDNRSREIKRLKDELNALSDANAQLSDTKKSIENQIYASREDKQALNKELEQVERELDIVEQRRRNIENDISKLQLDKSALEKENASIARENEDLTKDIRTRNESIKLADQQAKESERNISILQSDIKNLERTLDKYKSDTTNNNRSIAAEQDRGQELQTKLDILEQQLIQAEKTLATTYSELNDLKSRQLGLIDTNEEILEAIEANKRHVEVLIGENNEILAELERFADQDERCRQLLQRSERIQDLKQKVDSRLKASWNNLQVTLKNVKSS